MIKDNLEKIYSELENGNNLGEKITLVGATKFVDAERINEAIDCGLKHIGENRAQELRDKFSLYKPAKKHFIGIIQANKLKYIVGKADCIDSVDSIDIASKISELSLKENAVQDIMLEVNIGEEPKKGGFLKNDIMSAYKSIKALDGIKVTGIMSMLPIAPSDEIASFTRQLREIYDYLRKTDENIEYLSVGISSDYKITIQNGANMVRLGRAIFGERR